MDKTGKLHLADQGIDNMINLVELSDQSLLANLQTRYNEKLIYTYIGSILISINPYTELGIYDTKHIQAYQNKSLQDMPPHLFGIGEINFSKMILENENQVIVISGESGAGKTESFKKLLQYFAHVSGGLKKGKQNPGELSNDIASKILDSTPLLESFGNAQTIRNDNSSRFGKYVEIFFENGIISGSRIINYLLETSRIVKISPAERGYHIFYEVLQGLDKFSKTQYYFKDVKDYAYLNNSKNFSVKDRNDASNLAGFMNQWTTLGMSNDEMDVVMRILSAVLHLGNIKFMEEQEVSYLVETENISIVAKMLKVDKESLKHCLTMKTTETVKDATFSPLNVEQSYNYRDTLAKHLYSELFNWIVVKVNEALNQNNSQLKRQPSNVDRSINSSSSNLKCIAMLDIYGFENFPENSLEQLCINYANETLQQFFNRYVFELEQAEYKQEGISWHYITYPDNQPIIDLLSAKPNGIIQVLNDECSIPQGSDEAFLTKCHNIYQKNPNYEKPKKQHPPQFIIHHFAGHISYTVKGFLEKNRDVLRKEILNVIEHCEIKEIAAIFQKKREQQLKNPIAKARTPTVMGDFQNSLISLLAKMKTCQPWFIRCLKPNNNKEAMRFNKEIVMDQMRYTGILETVKIRKSGFPIRILFSVFLSRFYLLVTKEIRKTSQGSQQEACIKLMSKFQGQKSKDFEIGKTKLFLKEHFARHLENEVRVIRNRCAIIIQRKWRAYWKIKFLIVQNQAASTLQAYVKGFLVRRKIRRLKSGILKLQSLVRMQMVRKKFLKEHPEFLKYANNHRQVEHDLGNSKMIAYKLPESEKSKKSKKHKNKKFTNQYNYDLLKIPIELAFIFERVTEHKNKEFGIPPQECIAQTGRVQHLWNKSEYKLPDDINEYLLANFLEDAGNNLNFESKTRPITTPYLNQDNFPECKEDSLIAHKLILRILYATSMPWIHRFLTTSYLLFMATKSLELQKEIFMQIIAETIPNKSQLSAKHFLSEVEEMRLLNAWNLLGNILSYIIPCPEIFNYILKYVSDSFGVDQAIICQEKLLHFASTGLPQIPRMYPASALEYRANQRASKTCMNIIHPDHYSNSVHLNSFTVAEELASHSLCFRQKKQKLMKGWSISVVYQDKVYDCGGQNYVFDLLAGLEHPLEWSKIIDRNISHYFLLSRHHLSQSETPNTPSRGFLKNPTRNVNKFSVPKNLSTVNSLHSMDSWVEKEFDSSFRHEDTSSIPVQDFINGLEDEPPIGNQTNIPPNPLLQGTFTNSNGISGNQSVHFPVNYVFPNPATMYFPATAGGFDIQNDQIFLQEQLNKVQLENKVIQSTIERELLQTRLKNIQQCKQLQGSQLAPGMQFSYQNSFPNALSYSTPSLFNPNSLYSPYPNQLITYQIPNYNQISQSNPYLNVPENQHLNRTFINNKPNIADQSIQANHNMQTAMSTENLYDQFGNINNKTNEMIQNNYQLNSNSLPISHGIFPEHQILAPPPPPPPPPPPNNISNHKPSLRNANLPTTPTTTKDGSETLKPKKKSILKYSDNVVPSNIIVDDSLILPNVTEVENKKSYLRASEVPKVNFSNRAAILEEFFKEKSINPSPVSSRPKRLAPSKPANEEIYPEDQANAINILASMNNNTNINKNKLIPRPSISAKTKPIAPAERKSLKSPKLVEEKEVSISINIDPQLPRVNVNNNKKISKNQYQHSDSLLPRESIEKQNLPKPVLKNRKYFSTKNAVILAGIPDMRYCTYQKTSWFLLLKREIYLPNEIQNTVMLNPVIFYQIVRDLIELPCIRWIGNERQRLLSILGNIGVTKELTSITSVPGNLMLQVINEVQNCELYFSRFFSIKWVTNTEIGGISHWMAVSHTGIRFVEQNHTTFDSELNITDHITFPNISRIDCKQPDHYNNPQILVITTRQRKKYKMKTIQSAMAKSLIQEFLNEHEITKSHGTINLTPNNKHKRKERHLLNEHEHFTDSQIMILGANNQRIILNNIDQTNNKQTESRKHNDLMKKQENLIEFVFNYSKHKDRRHIEHYVLRWQSEALSEPILLFSNSNLFQESLNIHRSLLFLSKDHSYNSNVDPIDYADAAFKILLNHFELKEEFILQIFKQINGNSITNGRNYLWNLLSIIILFLGPTQRIQSYLLEHLNQIVRHRINQDQHLAAYLLKICKLVIKYGPRKELPNKNEFDQLMKGVRETVISVTFSGNVLPVNVMYSCLVEEVIQMLCSTISVTSNIEIGEYSLTLVETNTGNTSNQTSYLKSKSYLFDAINSSNKTNQSNLQLYFIRMTWIEGLNLEYRSHNFISFTFNQLSKDILQNHWLLNSNNQFSHDVFMTKIAKVIYLNMRGQGLEKPKNTEVIKTIAPNKLFESKKKIVSKKQLIKLINSEGDKIDSAQFPSKINFQKHFLEHIEKLPCFGHVTFPITFVKPTMKSGDYFINFTCDSILLSETNSKDPILKMPLTEIITFNKVIESSTRILITMNSKNNDSIQFYGSNVLEIQFMLETYMNMQTLKYHRNHI